MIFITFTLLFYAQDHYRRWALIAVVQFILLKTAINEPLDTRALLVFQKLQRFYKPFHVLYVLVAGLSLAVSTFDEFQPTQSDLMRGAEGLFCSPASSAIVSAVLATMLLFHFGGRESTTCRDMVIVWSPLVILDPAIIELLGACNHSTAKNTRSRTSLMWMD